LKPEFKLCAFRSKHLVVDGNTVDSVNSFVYLESMFLSDGYCCPDINRCIGGVSSVMSSLRHIWKNHCLSLTKTCTYHTLVQSVLLYAAETWNLLSIDSRALEAFQFHLKCQRQLLQIKCHQFTRNDEICAIIGPRPSRRPLAVIATCSSAMWPGC